MANSAEIQRAYDAVIAAAKNTPHWGAVKPTATLEAFTAYVNKHGLQKAVSDWAQVVGLTESDIAWTALPAGVVNIPPDPNAGQGHTTMPEPDLTTSSSWALENRYQNTMQKALQGLPIYQTDLEGLTDAQRQSITRAQQERIRTQEELARQEEAQRRNQAAELDRRYQAALDKAKNGQQVTAQDISGLTTEQKNIIGDTYNILAAVRSGQELPEGINARIAALPQDVQQLITDTQADINVLGPDVGATTGGSGINPEDPSTWAEVYRDDTGVYAVNPYNGQIVKVGAGAGTGAAGAPTGVEPMTEWQRWQAELGDRQYQEQLQQWGLEESAARWERTQAEQQQAFDEWYKRSQLEIARANTAEEQALLRDRFNAELEQWNQQFAEQQQEQRFGEGMTERQFAASEEARAFNEWLQRAQFDLTQATTEAEREFAREQFLAGLDQWNRQFEASEAGRLFGQEFAQQQFGASEAGRMFQQGLATRQQQFTEQQAALAEKARLDTLRASPRKFIEYGLATGQDPIVNEFLAPLIQGREAGQPLGIFGGGQPHEQSPQQKYPVSAQPLQPMDEQRIYGGPYQSSPSPMGADGTQSLSVLPQEKAPTPPHGATPQQGLKLVPAGGGFARGTPSQQETALGLASWMGVTPEDYLAQYRKLAPPTGRRIG